MVFLVGLLYGGLGLFAALPMIHTVLRAQQFDPMANHYLSLSDSFIYYVLTGVFLWGGLLVYLARCPEKYSPGTFDIIGHSHQIWHMGVNFGVLSCFVGSLYVLYERRQVFCYNNVSY